MKSSTNGQGKGISHEEKGKVKEVADKTTNKPKVESEGGGEKKAGKVQQKTGQAKKVLGK